MLSTSYQSPRFTLPSLLPLSRWMQPPHPAAGRLHLDALWWTAGAETSEREIYLRAGSCALVSSAKPTTGIQVVRPAAPSCLNSLTPDAHRAGALHPRLLRFAAFPRQPS